MIRNVINAGDTKAVHDASLMHHTTAYAPYGLYAPYNRAYALRP
jgi:hypothetical protein